MKRFNFFLFQGHLHNYVLYPSSVITSICSLYSAWNFLVSQIIVLFSLCLLLHWFDCFFFTIFCCWYFCKSFQSLGWRPLFLFRSVFTLGCKSWCRIPHSNRSVPDCWYNLCYCYYDIILKRSVNLSQLACCSKPSINKCKKLIY